MRDINTLSDLLEVFRDRGIISIKNHDYVKHPVSRGNMFEGLTREIINTALFDGLDLHVVTGFIKNNEKISNQIDCMVVIGKGEELPFTKEYAYPLDQVLMIVEVKSNLYTSELRNAYENIDSVINLYESGRVNVYSGPLLNSYSSLVGRDLQDPHFFTDCNEQEKALCQLLIREQVMPVKVIWGYKGFSNELSLREKHASFLTELSGETGNRFDPSRIPDLIVAGDVSLIKTNGMPYSESINGLDSYCWMSSYRRSPLLLLLELLWTRLQIVFDLSSDIFGCETTLEGIAPYLLISMPIGCADWKFEQFKLNDNDIKELDQFFYASAPQKMTKEAFVVMQLLCDTDYMCVANLTDMFKSESRAIGIVEELHSYGFVQEESGELKLLTKKYVGFIDPEYGFMGGDDYNLSVTRWVRKRIIEYSVES